MSEIVLRDEQGLPAAPAKRRVTLAEATESSPLMKICGADGGRLGYPALALSFVGVIATPALWIDHGLTQASVLVTLLTLLSAAVLCYCWNFEAQPRQTLRMQRRQARLNKGLPWRPAEGEYHPQGRDDCWPREMVRVCAEESEFSVGLVHHFCDQSRQWHERPFEELCRVPLDDAEALGAARAAAQEERDRRTAAHREQWLAVEGEKMEAERLAAIAVVAESERAARRARDRQLADALSD